MKDRVEELVMKNRPAFDDREVPGDAWPAIRRSLFVSRAIQPIRYWQAAAVVFFALSAGLWFRGTSLPNQATREFADAEAFYTKEISDKMTLIRNEFGKDLNGFTQDFQQLEAMYMVLKEEMKQHPSEKVREALVLNLLVRINLLNKQLQEIEDSKQAPAMDEKSI